MTSLDDELRQKLKTLSEELWEGRATKEHLTPWLGNFAPDDLTSMSERLHALFLLSQFMYFGMRETRELLVALYRDVFKYPIVAALRSAHRNTRDIAVLQRAFGLELARTRFLGIGNPSESGQHLLYYFRQENLLPKELFINAHEVFTREANATRRVRDEQITRYVFIDDFCGSGKQAESYSKDVLAELKSLKSDASAHYLCLVATTSGLEFVRANTRFDDVRAVFTLDESYRVFGDTSRYFSPQPVGIDKSFCEQMCRKYGAGLAPSDPLGYKDSQLLIGFMHNVPDNTLPIMWAERNTVPTWTPIFRRYPKLAMAAP